jgi:hypothetical protein
MQNSVSEQHTPWFLKINLQLAKEAVYGGPRVAANAQL